MFQGPLNWYDAQEVSPSCTLYNQDDQLIMMQFCWSRGGYLAEVTSAAEQQALEAVLIHGKEYWLGLTDVEEQGDDDLV